jgi:hypothetical protein
MVLRRITKHDARYTTHVRHVDDITLSAWLTASLQRALFVDSASRGFSDGSYGVTNTGVVVALPGGRVWYDGGRNRWQRPSGRAWKLSAWRRANMPAKFDAIVRKSAKPTKRLAAYVEFCDWFSSFCNSLSPYPPGVYPNPPYWLHGDRIHTTYESDPTAADLLLKNDFAILADYIADVDYNARASLIPLSDAVRFWATVDLAKVKAAVSRQNMVEGERSSDFERELYQTGQLSTALYQLWNTERSDEENLRVVVAELIMGARR